jgi:DNA-binding transcriptional LysR family regulator
MDVRNLSYFLEVAKYKSFTKASENLFLTQPTLSKAVKSLEEELGVILIDRTKKRSVELTDAGKIVYEDGSKIWSSLKGLTLHLDDLMDLQTGEIKIGLPPLIGALFFSAIIKGFNVKFPNISIELMEFGGKRVASYVEEGEVDLGIVVLPIEEKKYDIYPFFKEELVLYTYPNHRFSNRKQIELSDLKEEQFILFNEDFILHDRIIQECQNVGFTPKIAYKSSQWDFIIEMVAAELGIAILPKSIYQRIAPNRINMIFIDNPCPLWEIGVIHKRNGYVNYASREFIKHVQ